MRIMGLLVACSKIMKVKSEKNLQFVLRKSSAFGNIGTHLNTEEVILALCTDGILEMRNESS